MTGVIEIVRSFAGEADFRRLLTSQCVGQAADGFAQAVAFEVLLLDPFAQGTPGRMLAVASLTLLPYSVIAPFTGVFIDRWDRRRVISISNYVRGALLMSFPLWSVPIPGDAELYAVVLALMGLGRLALNAKGAALPVVLHEHRLLRGNAVSTGAGGISTLVGGGAGIVGTGLLGTAPALVIAGILYVAGGLAANRIATSLGHTEIVREDMAGAIAGVARDLIAGLRAIGRRPAAWLPLLSIFLLRCIGMIVVVASVLIIRNEFPDAADRFGRLASSAGALAAAGAGAFAGAALAPFLGRRFDKPRLIILGYVVSGVAIVGLGGVFDLRALLTLTFIGGFGAFVSKVAVDAQLQEVLPDDYRGRAFAIYDILYNVATVVAALVIAVLVQVSLRSILVSVGAVALVLAWALGRPLRRL